MTRAPSLESLAALSRLPEVVTAWREILKCDDGTELRRWAAARGLPYPGQRYFCENQLHLLDAVDPQTFGVESMRRANGRNSDEWADYVNTGDSYAPTFILWRYSIRLQSVGDFLESMERRGIKFA